MTEPVIVPRFVLETIGRQQLEIDQLRSQVGLLSEQLKEELDADTE